MILHIIAHMQPHVGHLNVVVEFIGKSKVCAQKAEKIRSPSNSC